MTRSQGTPPLRLQWAILAFVGSVLCWPAGTPSVAAQEPPPEATDVEEIDAWVQEEVAQQELSADPAVDPRMLMLEKLVLEDLAALDAGETARSFDEELWALAVRDALARQRYVRARELTQQILDRDPQSFIGHCLMGLVFHRAEGNLPRAYFHMAQSRKLFEQTYGEWPADTDPWPWHAQSILGMAMVAGEMERHEEKIELLLEHDRMYSPPTVAERGWPLMRLRRYDEAREAVLKALEQDDREVAIHALTALCAIEAEQQDREASYSACREAAERERANERKAPTPFTNAGESSLGMLLFDEAESFILEGARHFARGTVSNPWLDLTLLYLSQGRTAEALDSVRDMFKWRLRQPPFMDEQNRAETEMTSAIFLLVAGHPQEAAAVVARAMDRPDRTGFTSSESEQLEAASALVDAVVHRVSAEMALEDAAGQDFRTSLASRARAWGHRLRAWSSGRRAASLLSEDRFLYSTMRPYLAGGIELPEWLKIELVDLLGAGVVRESLAQASALETLPGAQAYFHALGAEAAYDSGDEEEVIRLTELARESLPGSELLLRARVSARAAQVLLARGEQAQGLEWLDEALQIDPGVVRRIGLSLPVRVEGSANGGEMPRHAASALESSPRFHTAAGGSAFTIQLEGGDEGGQGCLIGPRNTRMACARVTRRAAESAADLGRRLALELQREAFAPRLDLTQADLRSLDGSPTAAGGRGHEKLNRVLRDVTGNS